MSIPSARVPVTILVVSAALLASVASLEKYMPVAHIPIPGDPVTIGYGRTDNVKHGDKTTPERELVALAATIDKFGSALKRCFGDVHISQQEFDSYVSLAYNVGAGAVCRSSIPAKLRAGRYHDACDAILSFNKAQGKVIKGLVNRRKVEHSRCMEALA